MELNTKWLAKVCTIKSYYTTKDNNNNLVLHLARALMS